MNLNRCSATFMDGDVPPTMATPPPPETSCEMDWPESWGLNPPIRLQPSEPFAGSSNETDRIINNWRPRIASLVEQSISMAKDLCEISWKGEEEPYPCCPFLKLINPVGRDMRRFMDEACHILLQASSKEEIFDSFWFDGRAPDARDVMEWMERWAVWLPDEDGQFLLWSAFLPCDAMEALYRYVHGLVHDYYLEILELHMEWEERMELESASGEALPDFQDAPPESILYYHPRLIIDEREFSLTAENAEELRDWSYDAFVSWGKRITKEQREALVMLGYEADQLCPIRRWPE